MKKIIVLLFCIIIVLTSCGVGPEVAVEEEDLETAEADFKDMDGARFIFGTIRTNEYFEEEGYSSAGDKMRKRYKDTAEKFNCTLDVIKITNDTTAPIVMQAIAAMTDVYDFIDCNSDNGYTLFKEGALVAYDDLNTLDITDSRWGSPSFRANGIFKGKSYGVFNNDWEFIPQVQKIILINSPLIRKNGMNDPYEMQEKKEWTWENFRQELDKGTYDEGENKYIGMTCEGANLLPFVAALSNGARLVDEKDGNMTFGFSTPEAIAGFEFAALLNKEKLVKASPGNLTDFTGKAIEAMGVASYAFCSSWMGTIHIAGCEFLPSFLMEEYGFIYFPNGPSAGENNCSSYIGNERLLWCILPGDNEPDDKGLIMNYVFSPLDDSEKEGWKSLARSQTFHHPQDYDNFIFMIENSSYNYITQLGTAVNGKLEAAYSKIMLGKESPASVMASVEELVNEQIKLELGNEE